MANGFDFERQVHVLLKNMGFEAEITRASGDGGIDIIAHSKEHIRGGKYVIQCKDWSKPVGEPPVRDLYGVVTAENANKGILITTSTFTAPALKFAEGKTLELIDGTKFNQLLAKYNLTGSHGGSMSIVEVGRINELTKQLNKNPKNILVLKELADIYLLQGDYNKAIELYEPIVSLKPSVETERLKNAHNGGLNNYGVALAKLKRYDDALKIFKENGQINEPYLLHYLELYDIAISIYQKMKMFALTTSDDNPSIWDENIEKAYAQTQSDFPYLFALINKDGKDEWMGISLETALQKAKQEGKQEIYTPLFNTTLDITKEFGEIWTALRTDIANDQLLTRSDAEGKLHAESLIASLIAMENRCLTVISNSTDILMIATTNELQEAYKENVIRQITLVTTASDSISRYKKYITDDFTLHTTYDEIKKGLITVIDSCYSAFNDKILEYESLGDRFVEEEKNVAAKWEETINKEKNEWREKLRRTLYSNWVPTGQKIPIGQNRQCFIATAVYGSPFVPEVEMLRQWRDQSLSKTRRGRSFISIYYKYSPGIASFIEHRPFLKWLIRKVLNCLVRKIIRVDSIIQKKN